MATTLVPPPQTKENRETDDALEAHVYRILRSPHLARAETQRRLLEYLWLHRDEALSEYALATEALGRSSSFDSTVDASVRVHISRLRRKLKDYYQQEPGEPELIAIPTGTHQLFILDPSGSDLESQSPATAAELQADDLSTENETTDYRRRMWIMTAVAVSLAVVTVSLLVATTIQRRNAPHTPKLTSFWTTFLQGNAPVRILLPTPTFFQFSNRQDIRLRSTNVNDFESIQKDPAFAAIIRDLGTPRLEQSYTVTWDTLAAVEMARYLDAAGHNKDRITIDVMRDSSMNALEHSNVIALGTHQTLEPMHAYLQAMNFSLSHDEMEVQNAHPLAGEPANYSVVQQSTIRSIRPSIISVLPGRAPGLRLLILESRDTAALVAMLSSTGGSNSIREMLHAHGDPQFFEMVVQTEMEDNHALRSWPVTVHPFHAAAPASAM